MPLLNISKALIHDPELFRLYVAKAAVLLRAQGVEVLCRGRHSETLRGSASDGHVVAVFRFADREAVRRFYEGPDYQPLIALRDSACDMTIDLYEE